MVTLAKPRLMQLGGHGLTDHNRGPLQIDTERIENKQRMADGTMRKYVVADKRTFTIQWDGVPGAANQTVDKLWGADDLETFYYATYGPITLNLTYATGRDESITVMIESFSKTLNKRGLYDLYTVNLTLEEV